MNAQIASMRACWHCTDLSQKGGKPLKQNPFCCSHQEVGIGHFAGQHILPDSCHSVPNCVHACQVTLQGVLNLVPLLQLPLCLAPWMINITTTVKMIILMLTRIKLVARS